MNELPQAAGGLDTVDRLDIAGLTLDLRREELRDATGVRIELRNRSFGVLRHLATNAGRVVTKDELLEVNWPGVTVTEDSLTQCISEIRRALGDAGRDIIRTVPRRGYMIVLAEQSPRETGASSAAIPSRIAAYRHPGVVVPVVLGLAVLISLGA
jgi:DNA-binding winged helix-turn-helix (wHTH) protein